VSTRCSSCTIYILLPPFCPATPPATLWMVLLCPLLSARRIVPLYSFADLSGSPPTPIFGPVNSFAYPLKFLEFEYMSRKSPGVENVNPRLLSFLRRRHYWAVHKIFLLFLVFAPTFFFLVNHAFYLSFGKDPALSFLLFSDPRFHSDRMAVCPPDTHLYLFVIRFTLRLPPFQKRDLSQLPIYTYL